MLKGKLLLAGSIAFFGVLASSGHGEAEEPKTSTFAGQYRIQPKKSRFVVETQTSGLSEHFAHDHRLEVDDYSGTATVGAGGLRGGSLTITARASSLRLLGEDNVGQRQVIESALREEVLETSKFPDISFKSKTVTALRRDDGTYDVRLAGQLRLHGMSRQVTLPARVSLDGNTLHALGIFEIRQTDFNITPFSFVPGAVVIKDAVTISFDIVATRS